MVSEPASLGDEIHLLTVHSEPYTSLSPSRQCILTNIYGVEKRMSTRMDSKFVDQTPL